MKRPEIYQEAVIALGKLGSNMAKPELLNILEKQSPYIQHHTWTQIFEALEKLGGEDVTTGVLKLLKHSDFYIRLRASETLGNLGDQRAVTGLIEALEDNNDSVQYWAGKALGQLRDKTAIPKLIELLQRPNTETRKAAIRALGELRDEIAVPVLLEILEEQEPTIRYSVIEALKELGSPAALNKLQELWKFLDDEFVSAIAAIQNRCKFYNYEIWCEAIQTSKLELKNGERGDRVRQTTTIFNIETLNALNAALNLGGTIHGDQIGTQSHPPKP